MRYNNLMLLSWQNLRRNRKRVILSSIGMVIGIATLIIFFSLTSGARTLILENILSKLPANQVKLNPQYGSGLSQGNDRIEHDKAETIRGLEGVKKVYGMELIEASCYLYAFDAGGGVHTKLGISGYETDYFVNDLPESSIWKWQEGDTTVPLLINPTMLVSWNEIFSNTFGGTKLTMETISSVPLYLRIYQQNTSNYLQFDVKVVGQTNKSPMFAPLVPLEFIKSMNSFANGQDYQPRYSSLVVEMENPGLVNDFVKRIKKFQLEASADQRVAGMIETGITILTIFLTSISLVIVFISLINVFNIFLVNVLERKFEIGVMRAVGAGRGDIRLIFLGESAVIGLANGVLGILVGVLAILLLNPLFAPLTEQFLGSNAAFLPINWQLLLLILLVSPLVTILSVFQPANYAASLDPVHALRK